MVLTTSSTGAFQLIFGKTSNVAKTLRKPELRHKLKSTHRKGKCSGLFLYLLPLCGKDFRNIVLSHHVLLSSDCFVLNWHDELVHWESEKLLLPFLTLAKAAACNKALHAVHFTMSLPSWGIFQWQSANPCLNLTLGSNLGELCWLFQKMEMSLSEKLGSREDLIFHCWKLNIVGSFLSLKSAAYAMAKRPQSFPPFCCSTSATSIVILLDLGDIDSHTAFSILQSYRIVLCLFMFKACELSYTVAKSAALHMAFDTQTQCCGRWILWINFERFLLCV